MDMDMMVRMSCSREGLYSITPRFYGFGVIVYG